MKKLFFLVFIAITISTLTQAQSITDSLIFYYPCDGNLLDHSGNGLDATTNGTLTIDEYGNPESAYDLNGIDQFIEIPYSPLYIVEKNEYKRNGYRHGFRKHG